MNSTEIFTLALGLKEPWFISNVEILTNDNSVKELHIHFGFTRGSKFEDEKGESCSVHDTQDKTWQHLNFLNTPVFSIAQFLVFVQVKVKSV